MREEDGMHENSVIREISVGDGALGGVKSGMMMPQELGEEGANVETRSKSPPRQRKVKLLHRGK